jgi:hypothetical protein
MSDSRIIGDLMVLASASCVLVGSLINAAMIKKVNARLAKEQQFSYFEVRVVRMMRLPNEYRRFYPDGKMYIAMGALVALAVACSLCGLWFLLTS